MEGRKIERKEGKYAVRYLNGWMDGWMEARKIFLL